MGVFATHIDDILGCGEPGVMDKLRQFSELRFGRLKVQEKQFVHVGMELAQDSSFSVTLTQKDFTEKLKPLGTSPRLWAARQKLLSPEDVKLCQCKLGELCWLATVSRPDICARLARIASRINALTGCDVYRINDLVKTVKTWQQATQLKYSSSLQWEDPKGNMSMVGWSDAAYGNTTCMGKCRLGYVIGVMPSNLTGPCHIIQWTSKFTRKLVKSSLGGEVYAFSEMLDHMSMLREFYGHFAGSKPGMIGLEDCESLFTHLKKSKIITEKFLVRHFLSIQQAIEERELDNVFWIPGKENPADGLTKMHSEILPLLRLLESGTYNPGMMRPLKKT